MKCETAKMSVFHRFGLQDISLKDIIDRELMKFFERCETNVKFIFVWMQTFRNRQKNAKTHSEEHQWKPSLLMCKGFNLLDLTP